MHGADRNQLHDSLQCNMINSTAAAYRCTFNKQFRFVHQMKSSLRKQHFSSINHKHPKDERFEILHESKFSRTAYLKCRTSNWSAKHIDLQIPNKNDVQMCAHMNHWSQFSNYIYDTNMRKDCHKQMVLIWIVFTNVASMTNCNVYNYNTQIQSLIESQCLPIRMQYIAGIYTLSMMK